MFKTRHTVPGSAPATLTPLDPELARPPVIKLTEYNNESIEERNVPTVHDLPALADDGKIRWIEMNGLSDAAALTALGEKYELHPLALEDVWNLGQRPKVDPYPNRLFVIVQMIYRDADHRLCGEQVSMFIGPNLLITIQEEPSMDVFPPVRERLRIGKGRYIRTLGADYLAYTLIDAILDHYFPVVEALGDSLEELENDVLDRPDNDCVLQINHIRRTLAQLRRYAWPERDVVSTLMHDETGLISDQTKIFLRDCYDHSVQIMELVEGYRDATAGLMELYLSAVSIRTNETMRVLTVMSSIFIPLTFIAGVYGMNFDFDEGQKPLNMPELHHPWGYVICVLLMLTIAIGQLIFFRRKNWI